MTFDQGPWGSEGVSQPDAENEHSGQSNSTCKILEAGERRVHTKIRKEARRLWLREGGGQQ